ncbi:hypothetical protein [Thermodesulfobacterium hydrogeniphilum]|uniref:hypothetical protein n=1 Tax=Thermodesulfobacterium hydrogeniphilum TaxID=161156 RepID=UPI0005712CE5|nr:hypothetical protein [Thermodesulfobacterium hydrogeniphilum]
MDFIQKFIKFLIFAISIICFSCAKPKITSIKTHNISLFKEKKISLKGVIWWRVDLFKDRKVKSNAGYANFIVNKNFLYIELKTPMGSSLGLIKWDKNLFDKIKIYDFYHKKLYIIEIPQKFKTYEIPFYFLGLKERKTEVVFSKIKIFYFFSKKEKKGILSSPYFKLIWIIKKLELAKNEKNYFKISEEKFRKIKLINFY